MNEAPRIVLTGATSGLGRLAACELARRGAELILTARSADKAEQTRLGILAAAPDAQIDFFFGDFTRLDDVRRVGEQITARYRRVDVLINNAGLHAFAARVTPDGYPEMVAVNYLAPFVLTNALLPILRESPCARVVNVASEASRHHGTFQLPADLTDITPFTARESSRRYGKTKLMNVLFTKELARRTRDTPLTSNCLDPGFNVTGLGRELRFAGPLRRILELSGIGDPRRGADLIVALATDARYATTTGRYITLKGHREIAAAAPGEDPHVQAALWAATEHLLERGRRSG
ncbi:SDR family NAD(P)-dependent oxidoreductase [Nocardia asteroides]|uniref:SDR family NAD(P)-dependent oxidoreductase n=1 Tax=Nocardia asteroides TaxID=1824 RepID=UPI001E2A20A8|nr:SDR family NAD(P)-dependent oxidoreductase [Nocardia asteroides]UGT61019.1 SDR family NAD(P)-dependent oxidoreductase [Nocardia asteroides]